MAKRRWPIGQCRVCLGWGEKAQFADCVACSPWRRKHPERAACRRCGHESHLNTDGLCRICLVSVRLDDPGWIIAPSPGRPCQLWLLLPGDRLPRSQPLVRPVRGRVPDASRPPAWLERLRKADARPVDDPRICPPTVTGQLELFRVRHELTESHAQRIRDRHIDDAARVRQAAIAYANAKGYSTAWWRTVLLRLRLALAVRDADGEDLVREESLDDLPGFNDAAGEILRELGLLRPRRSRRPVKPTTEYRSCAHCGSWGFRALCGQCQQWRRRPTGECFRCRRAELPLRAGMCRACRIHVDVHGPAALSAAHVQLWLGGPFAPTLRATAGALGYRPPHHRARQRAAARRADPPPVSLHLVDPAQGVLFQARQDWSCIGVGALDQLPSLTPSAHALLEDFRHYAQARHWQGEIRRHATLALRILVAWLGAEASIPEADIRALPRSRPGTNARRVVEFLAARGLLIPDHGTDAHQRAVEARIAALPEPIAEELSAWVRVLRGRGRRVHPERSFETIRKYLGYAYPTLQAWSGRVSSLRQITAEDISDALNGRTGSSARALLTALRSMFRALKRERVIFRDPARGFSLATVRNLPAPIPTDRLRGLIDRARGPMAQLVVALVAIHAIGPLEITRLKFDDLDPGRGRLTSSRATGEHTVYFDDLTHHLATAWLKERHRRWPVTSNPHLIVTQQSAAMDTLPPVSRLAVSLIFRELGPSPTKLRQDRILDEAAHTADPIHLMRVFGITARTAVHYVYAAHPERRSALPR